MRSNADNAAATLRSRLTAAVATLFPGYFALVMATGIVSIATFLLGMSSIAWVLLVINIAAYAVLWLLTLARLIRLPVEICSCSLASVPPMSAASRGP